MATQVVEAVVITACMSLIVAGILSYILYRYKKGRRIKKDEVESSFRREHVPRIEFRQHGGRLRGIIVDEEGLDVLYLRKVEPGCFSKVWNNPMMEEMKRMDSREDKPSVSEHVQEIPMLQEQRNRYESKAKIQLPGMRSAPPPPPPRPPSLPPLPSLPKRGSTKTSAAPAPPPPPLGPPKMKLAPPAPPPPPPLPQKGSVKTAPTPTPGRHVNESNQSEYYNI